MNRSTRARRAAARCDEFADRCEAADETGTKAADLATMAKRYRRNANEWRRIADEESAKERARTRRCYCGRKVSTLPDSDGVNCSEHDGPHAALASV